MTALDAQEAARRLAYRHGGRNVGDNAATRPIRTRIDPGQPPANPIPDPDSAAPLKRWRHADPVSRWAPAVTLAVAVLLLALAVAVTW